MEKAKLNSKNDKEIKQQVWYWAKIAIGVWLFFFVVASGLTCAGSMEQGGQFGDIFGAVNALFSGAAFIGIIYTMFLQKEELEEQREELRLTRKEFKAQTAQMEQQNFENTFFRMLDAHKENVKGIFVSKSDIITSHIQIGSDGVHGRQCFNYFMLLFEYEYKRKKGKEDEDLNKIITIFDEVANHISQKFVITHYIETIKTIIKLIESKRDVDSIQKFLFLLKSQFSKQEISFLYYWSIGSMKFADGDEKNTLRFYLKKYNFFKDDHPVGIEFIRIRYGMIINKFSNLV